MPKKSKNRKADDDSLEDMSVTSRCSDDSDFAPVKKPETEIDLMDKVVAAVDALSEKRPDVRISALNGLLKCMRTNYLLVDDSWKYFDTFLSNLESVMKRGQAQEQLLAAKCLAVFTLQLSSFDSQSILPRFQPLLCTKISDVSVSSPFRGACANALALLIFCGNFDNHASIKSVMKSLEENFHGSCLKGDGKTQTHPPPVYSMHCDTIRAWGLIYTTLPSHDAESLGSSLIPILISLLQSTDLDVRLAAGEMVVLIYERIRCEINDKFRGTYFTNLTEHLDELATEATKGKSKTDLKKQRHSFRDIVHFLRTNEPPDDPVVKLGTETLEITSYCQRFYYDMFCQTLACGLNTHLQQNELVRAVLDLGPPVVKAVSSQRQRTQDNEARRFANRFACKVRTQYLSASRDKRSIIETSADS